MNDLFKESKISDKKSIEEILKKYFEGLFSGDRKHEDNKLQQKINLYNNLSAYEHVRNSEVKEIAARFNYLFEMNNVYLDKNKILFINDFAKQFRQCSFELVMAEFIGKKFKLNDDGFPPDLRFNHDDKFYFMECSTRISSQMDKFCELLERSDGFFNVAKIFFKKNEILKKLHSYDYDPWHFDTSIDRVWLSLTQEEQDFVRQKLTSENPLQEIKDWVYLSIYARMYFKEILPKK